MAQAGDKLATALERLHALQLEGRRVFRAAEFSRTTRDRLIAAGYLLSPIRGWLVASSPVALLPGESTPWYTSFWEFCAAYSHARFGQDWHLSAEQSLLLLTENWTIPRQVVVCSPSASNNSVELPFDTSLFDLRLARRDPTIGIPVSGTGSDRSSAGVPAPELRILSAEVAIIRVPESFFRRNPAEAAAVLSGMRDVTPLTRALLIGAHTAVAGRLIGALRHLARADDADAVGSAMRSAMHDVRESDPFEESQIGGATAVPGQNDMHGQRLFARHGTTSTSALALRIRALWTATRDDVAARFRLPAAVTATPAGRGDLDLVTRAIDERYASDAYHSLSIEGYHVTAGLIERVRTGRWSPDAEDRGQRDALAAHGYWLAFQSVKTSILRALDGRPVAQVVRTDHRDWYRSLFSPAVSAGIVSPGALAGYRNSPVFIRSSRHVPPRAGAVPDAMDALFECIADESHAGVAAVLAHWLFGYIHPYPDGNGRMARFLMNALLVSGGFDWTVIQIADRPEYMAALDRASVEQRLDHFTDLVVRCMARPAAGVAIES